MPKPNPNNKARRKFGSRNSNSKKFISGKPKTPPKSPVNGATQSELKQCEFNLGLDNKKFKSGG